MSFLALILSLPSSAPGDRTRIWRALRALGCGVLRDGMYVLPQRREHADALERLADEVRAAGGHADVFELAARDAGQADALKTLFDRSADYQAITDEVRALLARIGKDAGGTTRSLRALERRFEQVAAIDFFAGAARDQVAALLEMARTEAARRAAPDEPHAARGGVAARACADYQSRRWATRKRPWVDRLASAWLIKRHIDPRAVFVWIDKPAQCKGDMLGFDFDGAAFTHTGERVTFQTLAASFDLDADPVIARLGDTVRYLDIGGVPTAEAKGLEAVLAGARASIEDDDKLLAAAMKVFDWLATSYAAPAPQN
jgi:hypothetical protein